MINRPRIALAAAVSVFFLLPVAAHAGFGGSPTAPGAGKATDYCCATWEQSPTRHGHGANAIPFVNGTGCTAIAEDEFSRNQCSGTVMKCRGEAFTPSAGTVTRCLTP